MSNVKEQKKKELLQKLKEVDQKIAEVKHKMIDLRKKGRKMQTEGYQKLDQVRMEKIRKEIGK